MSIYRAGAAVVMVAAMSAMAQAQIPDVISFQGRLADTSGVLLTGTYNVTIRLYNFQIGGSAIWTEAHTSVPVVNGIHNIYLGTVTSLAGLAFDTEYWASVEINSGGEMSPRRRVTTAPYAFRAKYADTATRADTATWATTAVNVTNAAPDSDWTVSGDSVYRLTGNVGIGTTSPGESLTVAGSVSFDSTTFYLDAANNRVGIDTNVPISQLAVAGTVTATAFVANGNELTPSGWSSTGDTVHIDSAKVGIGTSIPRGQLDVRGLIRGNWFFPLGIPVIGRGDDANASGLRYTVPSNYVLVITTFGADTNSEVTADNYLKVEFGGASAADFRATVIKDAGASGAEGASRGAMFTALFADQGWVIDGIAPWAGFLVPRAELSVTPVCGTTGTYTVPLGKILTITAVSGFSGIATVSGVTVNDGTQTRTFGHYANGNTSTHIYTSVMASFGNIYADQNWTINADVSWCGVLVDR